MVPPVPVWAWTRGRVTRCPVPAVSSTAPRSARTSEMPGPAPRAGRDCPAALRQRRRLGRKCRSAGLRSRRRVSGCEGGGSRALIGRSGRHARHTVGRRTPGSAWRVAGALGDQAVDQIGRDTDRGELAKVSCVGSLPGRAVASRRCACGDRIVTAMSIALPAPDAPVVSIAAAIAKMEAIGSALPPADGLGCFNRMYLDVTVQVNNRIGQGFFADPAFMTELDISFANLYFAAADTAGTAGTPAAVPLAWRPLVDRTRPVRTGGHERPHQPRPAAGGGQYLHGAVHPTRCRLSLRGLSVG